MDNNPQVAIMMPVYNGEKTLPLAIASLIHQTYPYWKCYIVNDGSTDNTKEILDSLRDSRFIIIHFEENKGRPYARQAALDAAEGKYLAFLDADDFYHPEKLKLQVETFAKYNVSLVSCGNASFDSAKELKSVRGLGTTKVQIYKMGTIPMVAMRTSMVLLSISKSIKFDSKLKYAQDTDFIIKYLTIGTSFLVQDKVLYYYSEFDSVSKNKIIVTNLYGIHIYRHLFKKAPLFALKKILTNIIKIFFKLLLYPFVDANFYLKRRGLNPNKEIIQDYKNTLGEILRLKDKI